MLYIFDEKPEILHSLSASQVSKIYEINFQHLSILGPFFPPKKSPILITFKKRQPL